MARHASVPGPGVRAHPTATAFGRHLEQVALILVMFIASIVMWTGAPALWLWLAGRYSRVSQSDMNSLLLVLVGIPTTMVLIGKLLSWIDGVYTAHFGTRDETHIAPARWLHSLRGGRETEPLTMLDRVLVFSVALALLAGLLWFAFLSQGSQALLR